MDAFLWLTIDNYLFDIFKSDLRTTVIVCLLFLSVEETSLVLFPLLLHMIYNLFPFGPVLPLFEALYIPLFCDSLKNSRCIIFLKTHAIMLYLVSHPKIRAA